MYALPTVKIKSEVSDDNLLGFVVINEDDFDASQHELFVESAEPPDDDKKNGEVDSPKGGETDSSKQDDAGNGADNGDTGGSNDSGATPAYRAEHRGRGSYSIMDGETEVIPGLLKDAAVAFNALSDVEKAVFVSHSLAPGAK
jgi:hypothetical protein